jgi:hypothetical protein
MCFAAPLRACCAFRDSSGLALHEGHLTAFCSHGPTHLKIELAISEYTSAATRRNPSLGAIPSARDEVLTLREKHVHTVARPRAAGPEPLSEATRWCPCYSCKCCNLQAASSHKVYRQASPARQNVGFSFPREFRAEEPFEEDFRMPDLFGK